MSVPMWRSPIPVGQAGTTANVTLYGANIGGERTDLVWNDFVLERREVSIPLPSEAAAFDPTIRVTSVQAGEDFITYRLPTDQGIESCSHLFIEPAPHTGTGTEQRCRVAAATSGSV